MAKIGTGTKDSAWGWHSLPPARKESQVSSQSKVVTDLDAHAIGRGGCQNSFSSLS